MTDKKEIYQISEAFSMQPSFFNVGTVIYRGEGMEGDTVARIEEGEIFDTGDPYSAYIGYNAEGKQLFAYIKRSVNVIYK